MNILHYFPQHFHSIDTGEDYQSMLRQSVGSMADSSIATTLREVREQASRQKPDILHIHACWNISAYRAQHWAKQHNIPVVLSLHNQMQVWHMRRRFWLHKLPLLMLYQRRAVKTADGILTHRHDEQRRMEKIHWSERIGMVENALLDGTTDQRQMALRTIDFYQKVLDSNAFRLMPPQEHDMENLLLQAGMDEEPTKNEEPRAKNEEPAAENAPLPRRILIHAEEEGILPEILLGARRMGIAPSPLLTSPSSLLLPPSTITPSIPRFAPRYPKATDALTADKPLPKSRLVRTRLEHIRMDEKPTETENRLAYMLLNIQHELRAKNLSRRHLTELHRELRQKEYDEDMLQRMLKQLKISKFAARLMQILHETLALEEGFMPIEARNDKKTRKIRKRLFKTNTQ